jgi:hypothetical protein
MLLIVTHYNACSTAGRNPRRKVTEKMVATTMPKPEKPEQLAYLTLYQ